MKTHLVRIILMAYMSLPLLCLPVYSTTYDLSEFLAVSDDIHEKNVGDNIYEKKDKNTASAHARFGFKLFSEVAQQNEHGSEPHQNLLISPISVEMALAMALNGARGETLKLMAETLEIESTGNEAPDSDFLERVNSTFAQLPQELQNLAPQVELLLANSLWTRQGLEPESDFLQRNCQFFDAKVATLDFSTPKALETINQWVDTRTQGKIKTIAERLSPQTLMVLTNAIYFKAKWKVEFDRSKTQERNFHLSDGTTKQVPMMSQSSNYQHYQGEGFQAVSLPYGSGRVSMYLFLPTSDSSLDAFRGRLSAENWERWLAHFHEKKGDVILPRFKMEYSTTLNDTLEALGMGIAFSRKANFEGIAPGLSISTVKHKTVIEVNESGSEAAAATSVLMAKSATFPLDNFSFVADRPFFFAIRDNWTKTILFMGYVTEPM